MGSLLEAAARCAKLAPAPRPTPTAPTFPVRLLLGLAACLVGTAVLAQSPPPISLHGDLQADDRFVWGAVDVSSFVVRRARIQVEGTADERFRFRLLSDFGSGRVVNWSLTDAVRLQLSGEGTAFTAADGVSAREVETLVVGRVQSVS